MAPATLRNSSRENAYQVWSEQRAAGRSTGLGFGDDTIDLRTPAIDLRMSPLFLDPPPERAAAPSPAPRPAPAIADALRELNDQRLDGTITDDEFKARKAELFASQSPAGRTHRP